MDLDATANKLEEGGSDTILLRRLTGRGAYVQVKCAARINKWQIERLGQMEAAGGIAQGDRICTISNREIEQRKWPGPPRRGDVVVVLGDTAAKNTTATVQGCDTYAYQGRTIRHDLTIRGS